MAGGALLGKLRSICLELPGTKETLTWGHPNFRVGDKIFSSFSDEDGAAQYSFKADKALQAALVSAEPERFAPAHYVGQHGWVTAQLLGKVDWAEVSMFVLGSYRLIAPNKLVKALDREEAHQAEVAALKPPRAVAGKPPAPAAGPAPKRTAGKPPAARAKPKATARAEPRATATATGKKKA